MRKLEVSTLFGVMAYPFLVPFQSEPFVQHMLNRTARFFLSHRAIKEKIFVAVGELEAATLGIILPKGKRHLLALFVVSPHREHWELDETFVPDVHADLRLFLAGRKAVVLASACETTNAVIVEIEMQNRHKRAYAAAIVQSIDGPVLAPWAPVATGVAMPLLPATPENLQ